MPFVVVNFLAMPFEFGLRCAFSVLKAVQNDVETFGFEGFNFVKNVHHAAVISGKRNVKGNEVEGVGFQFVYNLRKDFG